MPLSFQAAIVLPPWPSIPGVCRARHRIRRCGRKAQLTGMVSLRDSVPLAVPAFHGDGLDVARGLRAGRI
jgi:hypothetical protein